MYRMTVVGSLAGAALLAATFGAAAFGREYKLSPPTTLAAAQIAKPAGRSVKSATAPLTQAGSSRSFEFVCAVWSHAVPSNCIPASSTPAPLDWREFEQASKAYEAELEGPGGDKVAQAALDRALATSLAPDLRQGGDKGALYRFTVTVAASDRVELSASRGDLTAKDVVFETRPDSELLLSLFPSHALRSGVGVTVRAICRVEADRSLMCREGQVAAPLPTNSAWDATMARRFVLATYQAMSAFRLAPKTTAGADVVGYDLPMALRWTLP
jgi:hypothetical protein